MPVDPKRTAVVLIEYQNDFTSEGGALHAAVHDVMDSTWDARKHARTRLRRAYGRRDDRPRSNHLRAGLR